MKKVLGLLIAIVAVVSSCQQGELMKELEADPQTRSANHAFAFFDSYISWNNDKYMLDYAILANSNPALDATITIPYVVTTDTGYSKEYSFVIPAGSTDFGEEGTTLGEAIVADMNLDRYQHFITSVTILPYRYSGSMTIVGLDSLDEIPSGIYPPSGGSSNPSIQSLSAVWTKGSYKLGGELKELNYFNVEGGMGVSYTLKSKGNFVMEVELTNTSNAPFTYKASDFAIQENGTKPYSVYTEAFMVNNSIAHSISSITLAAQSTRTIYFHTNEFFYRGNGKYDYVTTPPYYIRLMYKDSEICGDYINVDYSGPYTEGWN